MENKNNLPQEPRSGSILIAVGFNPRTKGSGITQFAEGEPKRRNYDNERFHQWMEGGNGMSEANEVTLCLKGGCRIA